MKMSFAAHQVKTVIPRAYLHLLGPLQIFQAGGLVDQCDNVTHVSYMDNLSST